MTPYDKLIARKRKWTPVQTTAGKLKEGAEEAVFRALALRNLELPVGEFITAGLKGEVPEAAQEILLMNVLDEENHRSEGTRLNSSHITISYAVFCLKKKTN